MPHVVFNNRREIHLWLWEKFRGLLDEAKRAAVEELIDAELDLGQVTKDEIECSLVRGLRRLRDSHIITYFEYEKILSALREREK